MIYFIQADDPINHIKIGFTDGDPAIRLRALQTGSSVPLRLLLSHPGTTADEAALHARFAAARLSGEWFRPTPAILAYLLSKSSQMATPHVVIRKDVASIDAAYRAGQFDGAHSLAEVLQDNADAETYQVIQEVFETLGCENPRRQCPFVDYGDSNMFYDMLRGKPRDLVARFELGRPGPVVPAWPPPWLVSPPAPVPSQPHGESPR